MDETPKAAATASLPQYRTPYMMERFLDAAHEEGREIERLPNTRGIKLVDGSEMVADALDYFDHNKNALECEFRSELSTKIGKGKTDLFCDVIATDWYDGKGLRNAPRVLSIKLSVRQYLEAISDGRDISSLVINDVAAGSPPILSKEEIVAILTVNDQMLTRHIEEWKARRSDWDQISDSDIFFKRGLSLNQAIDDSIPYREWDFINSYSLALSAPEKFSQMLQGGIPAIVSGDLSLFHGRILFFSPFVPGMIVGQLEAGVIPAEKSIKITSQGEHGGILEYILGEGPYTDS